MDKDLNQPDFKSGFITIAGTPNTGKSTLKTNLMMRASPIRINKAPQNTPAPIFIMFKLKLFDSDSKIYPLPEQFQIESVNGCFLSVKDHFYFETRN